MHATKCMVVTLPHPCKTRTLERRVDRAIEKILEELAQRFEGPMLVECTDICNLHEDEEDRATISLLIAVVVRGRAQRDMVERRDRG